MIRSLLMLVVVLALMGAARSFAPASQASAPGTGTVLGFGFLVLAALQAGRIFAALRLPRLTGYLLCGLLTGPGVLGLLSATTVTDLRIVNGVAVSLIALTAGSELDLRALRPRIRGVLALTAVAMPLALINVTLLAAALAPQMPFLAGMTADQRWTAALTLGVVLVSLSPAVTIAILAETGAEGPVSETALGVVVIADIAVIIAFTAVHALGVGVFGASSAPAAMTPLAALSVEIFGSAGMGLLVALAILAWHRVVRAHLAMFILAMCIIAAELGSRLHLDALLVCLSAGLLLQNVFGLRGEVLTRTLAPAGLPIYAVFFALAGARLHLHDLALLWPLALAFFVVRGASLVVGARIGARIGGADTTVQRWAPLGLISQAGVSVGLAELLGRHFPTWGGGARALVLSVVTLNELVGPVLLRLALTRSDEVGRRSAGDAQH